MIDCGCNDRYLLLLKEQKYCDTHELTIVESNAQKQCLGAPFQRGIILIYGMVRYDAHFLLRGHADGQERYEKACLEHVPFLQ